MKNLLFGAGLSLLLLQNAWATPYPAGQSYVQTADQLLVPAFDRSFTLQRPQFALLDLLTQTRQEFYQDILHFDRPFYISALDGAVINLHDNTITLANGSTSSLPDFTDQQALAIGLASYDAHSGLEIELSPLAYQVYFAPMTRTHLRAFTRHPDGRFADQRYDDLCAELESIRSPAFYFTTIDSAIRGQFDIAASLPQDQQAVLIDLIGISMAEHYLQFRSGNPYNTHLQSKTGPLYNLVIDSLLFNYGGFQLDQTGKPIRGNCRYYLDGYSAKSSANQLYAKRIANVMLTSNPVAYMYLSHRAAGAVSLHSILAYFAGHPENYDVYARAGVSQILQNLPYMIAPINRQLTNFTPNL